MCREGMAAFDNDRRKSQTPGNTVMNKDTVAPEANTGTSVIT
jgi:hypothetical protein